MGFIEQTIVHGVWCNSCHDRLAVQQPTPLGGEVRGPYEEWKHVDSVAESEGWSKWLGRSIRHYCPGCAERLPTKQGGESMDHVYGPRGKA